MTAAQELLEKIRAAKAGADLGLINRAYEFALEAHKDKRRASEEPFIVHPLEVAAILAEFGLDEATICAGLLHDVLEEGCSREVLEAQFGPEISGLVDGVTKLTELKAKSREDYNAESLSKMLLASARDVRVIIIKLADKLHNMRTLSSLSDQKKARIAQEVLDIYAPLAHRLGIEKIKCELEDLAFKELKPEIYQELEAKVASRFRQRQEALEKAKAVLELSLSKAGLTFKVVGRVKHLYSIWRKMQRKGRTFEEIFDVLALKVIVNLVQDCYKAIGIVHNIWKPIPRRFKDYIAMPKPNMYQSLHTVVLSGSGEIIEVQVRTEEMEKIAEHGIAAHWKYKELASKDTKFDKKLNWLRQLIDWKTESGSAREFVESLQLDLFKEHIYTFTPRGDVLELVKGATPLDFAYAVHTEVGEHCAGAKVNGVLVSLRHELRTGDVVEILTSKSAKPNPGWLKIVKSAKARNKIRKALQAAGKLPSGMPKKVAPAKLPLLSQEKGIIVVTGIRPTELKLAGCCLPEPGSSIVGFATKSKVVTVHTRDCQMAKVAASGPKQKVTVAWREDYSDFVELKVEALDRVGLLADIANTIAAVNAKIEKAYVKVLGNEMAQCRFDTKIESLEHLKDLITRIKRIKDVKKVWIGKLGL